MKKRASAIVSLFALGAVIGAYAIYIAGVGRPGEIVGHLETAIVQLYGSAY